MTTSSESSIMRSEFTIGLMILVHHLGVHLVGLICMGPILNVS
jgi:hypothetical protein